MLGYFINILVGCIRVLGRKVDINLFTKTVHHIFPQTVTVSLSFTVSLLGREGLGPKWCPFGPKWAPLRLGPWTGIFYYERYIYFKEPSPSCENHLETMWKQDYQYVGSCRGDQLSRFHIQFAWFCTVVLHFLMMSAPRAQYVFVISTLSHCLFWSFHIFVPLYSLAIILPLHCILFHKDNLQYQTREPSLNPSAIWFTKAFDLHSVTIRY